MEQSVLLRAWMKVAGLTREEAAEELGIKTRRLDAWLLPETSKERRAADPQILDRVRELKAEADVIAQRESAGKLRFGKDATSPFVLERGGDPIIFPALYRVRVPMHDLNERQQFTPTGEMFITYSFRPDSIIYNERRLHIDLIDRLDPTVDEGWLSVVHLASPAELEGYFLANLFEEDLASIEVCQFSGSFFALKHHRGVQPVRDGMIIYASRYGRDHPQLGLTFEYDVAAMSPSGARLVDEDIPGSN